MSSWKRLSNLAGGKARKTLADLGDAVGGAVGSKEVADRRSEELAMERALRRELAEDAARDGGGPQDPDDLAARAREVRERIAAATALRGDAVEGGARPAKAGGGASGEAYEPPGPPEKNADGSVKRTL